MSKPVTDPILRAQFNTEVLRRPRQTLFQYYDETTDDQEVILINLLFNNALSTDNILDPVNEQALFAAVNTQYRVRLRNADDPLSHTIIVVHDPVEGSLTAFIQNEATGELTLQRYLIEAPNPSEIFITETITQAQYLEEMPEPHYKDASALIAQSSAVERLLFFIVFFEEIQLSASERDIDTLKKAISKYLNNRVVTLYLNNNRSAQLYGHMDTHDFIHLSLEEHGTPNTYRKRIVQLPLVIDQISE